MKLSGKVRRMRGVKMSARLTRCAAWLIIAAGSASPAAAQSIPNPVLYITGTEHYSTPSGKFVRYRYDVLNKDQYPSAMFQPAPALQPCGSNTNASRSWVDFFDSRNKRLYGFCALSSPQQLGQIWFALPEGAVPPSYVYIEIHDRQTNSRYRSNLADTSQ
jgi:hypothetical protein